MNVLKIWANRNQIVEGIKNNIFKREDIEEVAFERLSVCKNCPSDLYTNDSDGCEVPGTQYCCDKRKGGCGCSITFKIRSLSSECPMKHWKAIITESEEDQLNKKLGI